MKRQGVGERAVALVRPRRTSAVGALLVGLLLWGCSGGNTASNGSSRGPRSSTSAATSTTGTATGATTGATATSTTESRPAEDPVLSGFVAFGDFGGGRRQDDVASAIERWVGDGHRVDALVTTGDNVYETGDPRLFHAQLDVPYANLRTTRPLWVTLGNHDVKAGHGATQLRYLGLPDLPYAKELPGIQLLFLDGNEPDVAQARWLEDRLAADGPPARVVVFHQPAYSCGYHGSTEAVIEQWVPLFERYKVTLVLNGHDHHYERFESSQGVTYVVTGGGGRSLYPFIPGCMDEPEEQAGAVRYHFVGIEVRERSLTLTAVADDGDVIDTAVIEP